MPSILDSLSEYNALARLANERGFTHVRPVTQFRMSRTAAERRVLRLRTRLQRAGLLTTTAPVISPVVTSEPSTGEFTFGVELECILPRGMTRNQIAAEIRVAGIECQEELYNHSVRSGWKVVTDGSLNDYTHGCELVSPVLVGEEGFRQLKVVCDVLTAKLVKVDRSCGLHVHVGVRNEGVAFFKALIRAYRHFEPVVDSMVPPSRRNSTWCGSVQLTSEDRLDEARTVGEVASVVNQDNSAYSYRSHRRYRKLNLQPFWQHGTVEFRQHSGTVEARKAEMWVKLCLAFCRAARLARVAAEFGRSVEGLAAFAGFAEDETSYFRGRVERFAMQTRRAA